MEFYDLRAAESALRAWNRGDISGKRIKIESGGSKRWTRHLYLSSSFLPSLLLLFLRSGLALFMKPTLQVNNRIFWVFQLTEPC